MFISNATRVLRLLLTVILFFLPDYAGACSCSWKGPFMAVARDAPIVVRGTVIRHNPGPKPSIDFHVKEVLSGAMLDSGMRILTGDGMYCRPDMSLFPEGSEWVIAVNGPGSKPGKELAISHCGEYWLKVEEDDVVGSIFGTQGETRRLSIDSLRDYFRYPKFSQQLRGRVERGGRFTASFGIKFEFSLEPTPEGWEIMVREKERKENLARLSPPLHSAPNQRYIDACHFAESPGTCPCAFGTESAPYLKRKFIFSPEVGKSIDGPNSNRSVSPEDLKKVELFGTGELHVEKYEIETDKNGCPALKFLEFRVLTEGGYKPEMLKGITNGNNP